MPLSPIAEAILQPIAELILHIIGYLTARIIVPFFTLGLVHVEPGPHKEFVAPRFGNIQRHNGKLIMHAELGALIGIIFWVFVVVGSFAYYNNS
jgi:hypothetical protein